MTSSAAATGAALRVLLVEDSAPVAEIVREMLESEGIAVVGPAAELGRACALAASEPVDAALLDPDIAGEPVWPVADALARRGVPFAFFTGNESVALPPRFGGRPIIGKPFRQEALVGMVRGLAARRAG